MIFEIGLAVGILLFVSPWLIGRLFPETAAGLLTAMARRQAGLTERRMSVGGIDIAWWDGGQGEPLVLVHGMGASRGTFLAVAGFLTPRYRVIIPDLPGFGDSGKPPEADYSIGAQVGHLDRLMTALGLAKAHLGGNSMGGWIVAAYAARFPEKVSSLWLLAAAGTEDLRQSIATTAYLDRQEYILLPRGATELRRVFDLIMCRVPPIPRCMMVALGRRAAANFPLHKRIFDELVRRAVEFQLEPRLPGIAQPTLLVWGAHDRVVPPSALETFHSLLPRSEKILLPDVAHVPQVEAPRRVAEDYIAFRDRL